jgi:predicted nucleotide-binding protein
MQVVHALFVDDEELLRKGYIDNLRFALRDSCGIELTYETADEIERAREMLPRGQEQFQLVVVDMLWQAVGAPKGERDSRGLHVIEQARKTSGVVVAAVSVGDTVKFPLLEKDALARGAHVFRIHGALHREPGGWERLALDVADELRSANVSGRRTRTAPLRARDERPAFVVCGRDARRNESVFQFIRAIGVTALEWKHLEDQAVKEGKGGNPHIFDIVRVGFERAFGAIIIFSPDDEARLRADLSLPSDSDAARGPRGQPRPNVLLEAGYALCHARDRTLIVTIGELTFPSDLAGMHMLRLDNTSASRMSFAERLRTMGFPVSTVGDHWLRVGDFS